jgi:NAD(P)H-hydrate epimerase
MPKNFAGTNRKTRRIRIVPPLPSRRVDAHKGDCGAVLVIGGSRGMIGAAALTANGALRAGAGLVTVACPASVQPFVAVLCPCATTIPLPENRQGIVDPGAAARELREMGWLDESGAPAVVAAGPGLGRGDGEFDAALIDLLHAFGDDARVPVVLDADALNAMHRSGGARGGWDRGLHFRTIVTPHPGELARMRGEKTADVQADREGVAVRMAREMSGRDDHPDYRSVVVLKGHRTIVTDGATLYVNRSGNAGMATGGSGDVLTGIIAGLVAQRTSGIGAAILGAYLHGLAGDLVAKDKGIHGVMATDLLDFLPAAMKRHSRRK